LIPCPLKELYQSPQCPVKDIHKGFLFKNSYQRTEYCKECDKESIKIETIEYKTWTIGGEEIELPAVCDLDYIRDKYPKQSIKEMR